MLYLLDVRLRLVDHHLADRTVLLDPQVLHDAAVADWKNEMAQKTPLETKPNENKLDFGSVNVFPFTGRQNSRAGRSGLQTVLMKICIICYSHSLALSLCMYIYVRWTLRTGYPRKCVCVERGISGEPDTCMSMVHAVSVCRQRTQHIGHGWTKSGEQNTNMGAFRVLSTYTPIYWQKFAYRIHAYTRIHCSRTTENAMFSLSGCKTV